MKKQELVNRIKNGNGLSSITEDEKQKAIELEWTYHLLLKKRRLIGGMLFMILFVIVLALGLGNIQNILGFYNLGSFEKNFSLALSGVFGSFGILLLMSATQTKKNTVRLFNLQLKREQKLLEESG